ncbi:RNA polymerase, sigma 54 subunit, RpoN/SigL [Andreprevotia lacus DSM 23236]|uniref:RNA polymerase sigma-54 factor n=1 Tax=Andreprevotia lacus DSM 23236 TaxID=1121001 RepID=A0A1W1XSJ2_9NEIS|nr:RNA polymerase factor sigma-54 [Andreprevotia lacus]SMC26867.1 RNA polymerase, sigma 54 subunit, RpoN/SigL [Andreprevotia lacus DSM 23236]
MKQSLQLRMSQQLNLTPQLQQSIKLLQLSTLDFQQEIDRFLAENPLLEVNAEHGSDAPGEGEAGGADEVNPAESSADGPEPEYGGNEEWSWEGRSGERSGDDDDAFDPATNVARELSLREHLLAQVGLLTLPTRDRAVLTALIELLDDDGFLPYTAEELFALFPDELVDAAELEVDDLSIALVRLQQLDPLGVGARDMAHTLELQLRAQPAGQVRDLALVLVKNCLDLLAARDYSKLKRQLKCDDAELKAAQSLIVSLNPRPGAQWSSEAARYVVADVLVYKQRNRWRVRLNMAAIPKLRVNRMYAEILQRNEGGSLARELQEAKWLVKSVQQRFETILRVAEAIVERQRAFFEHGEIAMRPLVLRDIATELDLHESTISRVTTQKYMLTPRGIFEFKYFFGSHVETEAGGEASATAIKAQIRQLIAQEDTTKPLSDSAIAEALAGQGVAVARRTVAKYREAMNIPPVNLRKTL